MALIVYSVVITYIPFVTSLNIFYGIMAFISIINGSINLVGTYWIIKLWNEKNNFYMQCLHFSFSVGMALAPLISAPFMRVRPTNATESNHQLYLIIEDEEFDSNAFKLPKLFTPYIVAAGSLVFAFVISMTIYIYGRKHQYSSSSSFDQNTAGDPVSTQVSRESINQQPNSIYNVIIASLLLFFYMGTESNCNTFIIEFVTFSGYERKFGAYLASLLLTLYSIFRFISIFTSRKLPAHVMLFMNMSIVILASVLMLFASSSLIFLSITFSIFGIGTSSNFPSLYAYLGVKLNMSSKLMGILMASAAAANIVVQLVNGHLLQLYPMTFVYINLSTILASLLLLIHLHTRQTSHLITIVETN